MEKKNKSILIIDDDTRNIFALRLMLKSKGYNVVAANDAASGIELLKNDDSIGLTLLDMMMPEMDGYQALNIIREGDKTASVPVIAVTAQAMPGDREKCLEAGASDYISKPINVDELMLKLNKFLI